MATESVHVGIAVGCTAVGEQNHDLVDRFGVGGEIVPEHVRIFQVGLRVSFLCVDEKRELGGVAKEEDGGVVHDLILMFAGKAGVPNPSYLRS